LAQIGKVRHRAPVRRLDLFDLCRSSSSAQAPRPAVVVTYTAAVLLLQYSRQNFRNAVRNMQSFLW
jgi:hypothetical protein